jgi:hypothetical protein
MTASYMPVAERLLNIGKCGAARLLSQLPVGDPFNMAVSWRQVDGDETAELKFLHAGRQGSSPGPSDQKLKCCQLVILWLRFGD